ncbi:MAG: MotA/TolQ/ExbB proton channel family protein [Spirochaetales bacterium]|nr:MotA/TolQ/ExbB proton channel family protein [Spirochaetales bacterium]
MGAFLFDIIDRFFLYLESGGFVMWPLLIGTVLLWYGIAYRMVVLKRGSSEKLRTLITRMRNEKPGEPKGFIDCAVAIAWDIFESGNTDLRRRMEDAFFPLKTLLNRHRSLVRTIVIIAPLAGLLGTVSGMIEMFDSLGNQTFYSQTGGIANGISQALFTTQFGLFVAVPGLILGRLLDRKEDRIKEELFQLREYFAALKSGEDTGKNKMRIQGREPIPHKADDTAFLTEETNEIHSKET